MLGLLTAVTGGVLVLIALTSGKRVAGMGWLGGVARWTAGFAGAVMIAAACIVVVPKGQVAVIDVFGNVKEDVALPEGLHVRAPWWTSTMKLVQVLKTEHIEERRITALSGNALEIEIDIVMLARLSAEHAWCVVQRLEHGTWMPQLEALMRATVREAAVQHDAEPLVTTERDAFREEIERRIGQRMGDVLAEAGCSRETIVVQEVGIRKMRLPEVVREAVNNRTVAQQEVERMVHVIESERKEAERKEIEAGGIKRFQDIVSEGIDEELLRWKAIEATRQIATSPNTEKVVIIGGGPSGMPIVNPAQGASPASPGVILDLGAGAGSRRTR